MELNYIAIFLVTLVSFIWGSIWYGPLFWNLWLKIHWKDDDLSKKEMKKESLNMWKLLVAEFVITFLMINTLAFMLKIISVYSALHVAFMIWLWFIVPITISNIIWWSDKKKWIVHKILLIIFFRLIVLLFAGYVLSIW
jgi:hypothetical protein